MDLNLLDKLNDKQKEAALQTEGSILILAGAGSGKTRTITYRIANMIENKGINPYNILAVTFTNKAAKEMRERVENLVGVEAKRSTISTFHSFGLKLLRTYVNKIGYSVNFTIYDSDDQKRIVKNIIKDLNLDKEKLNVREITSLISKVKEEGLDVDGIYYKYFQEIYKKYNSYLLSNNAMDFSDILLNTYKLLKNGEILEKVQNKYKYIMIDEYQDTNNLQYKIIDLIARKEGNLCVVGDENQSIYGFRGANIENILNFEKNYENTKIIKLEENYRSTSVILDAANNIIKNNKSSKDKKLWTQNTKGDLIEVIEAESGRDEVNKIIRKIEKLINQGFKYKDITILYRTNAQSRLFEEGFLRNNIPHKVFGGISFYSRAEIKDIIAYLSVIINQKDELNLLRIINVPKRKLGDRSIEKIKDFALADNKTFFEAISKKENLSGITNEAKEKLASLVDIINELSELSTIERASIVVEKLLEKISYKEYLEENYENPEVRKENVQEFLNSIYELENLFPDLTLTEFLENISLVSATDQLEENDNYIKLMTIHNSKGLEFPVVFIVGMENEIFPGKSKFLESFEVEEERRLCYVAITRAEKKLYVSYSQRRFLYGEEKMMTKSMFLDEIPKDLCLDDGKNNLNLLTKFVEERNKKVRTEINTKNTINLNEDKNEILKRLNLNVGERVKHKKFGFGVIRAITNQKIKVQFIDGDKEIAVVVADKFLEKI